jgi:hypothetical protein
MCHAINVRHGHGECWGVYLLIIIYLFIYLSFFQQPDEFYDRLLASLHVLTDFFFAGGRGLSKEIVNNMKVYKVTSSQCCIRNSNPLQDLDSMLVLHSQPTFTLIESYYKNLYAQQGDISECKYGILNVRVYYNSQADLLVVDGLYLIFY